jgi:hypothetical protein
MKALFAIAAVAALTAGPVFADCNYPPPPEKLPDGATATMEEMVTGQKAVKQYDKDVNAYVACIKTEHDAAVAKSTEDAKNGNADQKAKQKAQQEQLERVEIQKHNAAIDQLQSIADRFNEQVRIYKTKSNGGDTSTKKKG